MKSNELLNLLECVGGLPLSEEFCKAENAYDNSGIILDCGEEIKGVLFSLDLSADCLNEAKKRGFNAIVTHHPAIYGGIEKISVADSSTGLLAECIRWGITVISMHLNFDAAPEGIDYHVMRGLGGDAGDVMLKFNGGAYGRAYDVSPCKFSDYVKKVGQVFRTERLIAYGDNDRLIKRCASFCGAGCDGNAINFALEKGADVFVSSDIKHHQITAMLSRGLNIIQLTHYAAENYGFNEIYKNIIEGLNVPSAYFTDEKLL